jgi:methionyl-tRNA formyltransferase
MATALAGSAKAGKIVEATNSLQVGCGEGILNIEEVQLPGGKRLKVRDFLAGRQSAGVQLLGKILQKEGAAN